MEVKTCPIALVSSTNMMIFVVFGVRAVVNVKIKVFMMIVTMLMITSRRHGYCNKDCKAAKKWKTLGNYKTTYEYD